MIIDENKVKTAFTKIQDNFQVALKAIHTGRPKPEMLETITVEAYDQTMELKSLTTIEVLDGKFRLQPWDSSVKKAIETAIRNSTLGLSPDVRDDAIYVSVPPLTEESRMKRVKEVGALLEEAKVRVRHIRHEFIDEINALEGVSEDMQKSTEKSIQTYVDKANKELEETAQNKEAELLKV